MAITAAVWEEAHEHHRLHQCFYALLSQGPGILTGLEVIASDPADTSVYISPGVAVDPLGQIIVLPKPVAYDIGREMEGLLHILLTYGESRPRPNSDSDEKDSPLYIHTEFSISARTTPPKGPWVELARANRKSRTSVFHNAKNSARPGLNEIDLRFRREVGASPDARVAVSYLGEVDDKKQGLGAIHLARTLNHLGQYRVFVEDDIPLAPGIEANTLIYLVGQGSFELSPGQMSFLNNYVRRGNGTLFIESLDSTAESVFLDILKSIDMEPKKLPAGHRLLAEPYLFVDPPSGFETEGKPAVRVNEGLIFSTHNYGRLWQGRVARRYSLARTDSHGHGMGRQHHCLRPKSPEHVNDPEQ